MINKKYNLLFYNYFSLSFLYMTVATLGDEPDFAVRSSQILEILKYIFKDWYVDQSTWAPIDNCTQIQSKILAIYFTVLIILIVTTIFQVLKNFIKNIYSLAYFNYTFFSIQKYENSNLKKNSEVIFISLFLQALYILQFAFT